MKKWVLLSVLLLVVTGVAQAIPNPAAVYCILQGYEYEIRTDEQGNQYGVCVFPDGSECGGWDYYCKCELNGIGCWPGNFTCHWPCKEMRCKEAGESVLVSKCCEGLDEIYPAHIFDANCNKLGLVGWLFLCSDCGNGICESWESKCNCPEDCAQPRIIYVDADANGLNNGSSWTDAYNYLQDTLAAALSEDEIWVAEGIYKPDQGAGVTTGDRTATFQLKNGVVIKGGYAGFGEPDPNARDIELYETILSGDLDGNDVDVNDRWELWNEPSRAENSYHVVIASGTDETAVLDGFTITAGNANGPISDRRGGGIYNTSGSPKLNNCIFSENSARSSGDGMYNYLSKPILTNCIFSGNSAEDGGAMLNYYFSSPMLRNCKFSRNQAEGGGGMSNYLHSNPTITNCTFKGNWAEVCGGGMYNLQYSSPTLDNCAFRGNLAGEDGGGMENYYYCSPTLINCIFNTNSAGDTGGGMYNRRSTHPTLTNCTFGANSAINGNALACESSRLRYRSNLQVANCILWNRGSEEIWNSDGSTIEISFSDVQGGETGVYDPCDGLVWGPGNIDADPLFADPNNGDYHLKSQAGRWEPSSNSWVKDDVTSPCIDAGDPKSPIGYEPFPNGGRINMGAYGGTAEASKSYFGEPLCETIVAGDINGDCKVNFLDFRLMALHWLEER